MTSKRYNLFPNKTFLGHMEFVGVAEDGKEIFNIFPHGGDNAAIELRVMPGQCAGDCKPCTKCKLAWRQLHPVEVKVS